MKLGIVTSPAVKEFDFTPFFNMSDPNFDSFCRKQGIFSVNHVVCCSRIPVQLEAARKANELRISTTEFSNEECTPDIIDESDVLLIVWDDFSPQLTAVADYIKKQQKPLYLIIMHKQYEIDKNLYDNDFLHVFSKIMKKAL